MKCCIKNFIKLKKKNNCLNRNLKINLINMKVSFTNTNNCVGDSLTNLVL